MRILIVSQYFSPEVTAASLRLEALARGLAERGHDVEVICEVPSHPAGVIAPGYRVRALVRERRDGYRVKHVWVWARPDKGARNRLLSYGSFAAMSTLAGAASRRPDVVFASSPPLSVGQAGRMIAAFHRVPWVMDVRDLWPEVAVALGELQPGRALDAAEALERSLYRSAAGVTVTTEPFERCVAERGAGGPIELLPNGTTREWLEIGETEPDRASVGLPAGKFVWTYAGNLGIAQGLGTAIEAARLLDDDFRLLMLGDGADREKLKAMASDGLDGRVEFRGAVQPSEAAQVMRSSDALLVSLADLPALERCVPGKLYQSGAMGRPVIVSAAGETRRLSEREGAALTVTPGDAAGLAAAVRRLRDDEALAAELVAGGRRLAAANLREDGVLRLERVLLEVTGA
jgi:glycosyltransferase involved in cell wall biosynthesis